jgi:hypothetical protein
MYNIKLFESVLFLLNKQYESEFQIIDGLIQHPKGYNFETWLQMNNIIDY